MPVANRKWFYLVLLSLVWGSSFILIKRSLVGFTPIQVGALRIVFAAIFLFFIGFKSIKEVKTRQDWKWIALAGFLSSFFPPILFALAQTQIDSGVTSIFNSLTPLNTTLVGVLLFGLIITKRQIIGVVIGLLGTLILIFAGQEFNPGQNYWYALFVLLSSLGYAFNINILKKYLSHLSPLAVTTACFVVIVLPAFVLLLFSGFFSEIGSSKTMQTSLLYVLVLSFLGTAVAKIYFNKLILIASPVFAASVTYTIPLVAILWGVWDGEQLNIYQLFGAIIVLAGVYLVNKKKRKLNS